MTEENQENQASADNSTEQNNQHDTPQEASSNPQPYESTTHNDSNKIDLVETLNLFKGGVLEPAKTWDYFLGQTPSWMKTAFVLAGPLVILSAVLSPIFSRMVGKLSAQFGPSLPVQMILGLLGGVISLALFSFIFNFFSKTFKGESNLSQSFAAVSLASIPAILSGIVGSIIPWLGGLIAFAGAILSLVFLYQIMPKALKVPEDKQPVHYIASILCSILASFLIFSVLGLSTAKSSLGSFSSDRSDRSFSGKSNSLGIDEDLLEEAYDDEYDPPSDGEVSKKQVKTLIANMREVRAVSKRMEEELKKTAEKLEEKGDKGNIGFSDLGNMMKGMKGVASMVTLEPVTVKRNGGNYAEHQWVKQTLQTSKFQRDVNETAAKNFALYEEYQDELDEVLN